jgi:hypothetical protein
LGEPIPDPALAPGVAVPPHVRNRALPERSTQMA